MVTPPAKAGRRHKLEFDLLGDAERVLDLDAEVADSAFELRVSEQKLNRSQVPRFLVNLGGLRPSHRVGTIGRAIEPSAGNPRMHDPRILSRREVRLSPKAAREQISPVPCVDVGEPVPDRCSGRFGDFEPDRSTGLPLDHSGTVSHLATDANVVDLQPYKVAAPQLAVDGEIEQGEVALTVL